MTRKDLAKVLKENKLVATLTDGEAVIDKLAATIIAGVQAGQTVDISRFGKFVPALQKGKSGTIAGKAYTTQDKVVPKFKASKAFKDSVAGK